MTSTRAQVVTRRTYNRQKEDGTFETWADTIDRVISHQRWLWERAVGRPLNTQEEDELFQLRSYFLARKMLPGGRILWLGGTDTGKRRESSLFNCSHLAIRSIHDTVDLSWLLLQGCGVGFRLDAGGMLNGFATYIPEIKIIRSTRTTKDGDEHNSETWEPDSRTWTIKVGDSGAAWAKSIGKLLAGKRSARVLQLDLSNIRPAGTRLANYGWISDGDNRLSQALLAIANILNRRAGQLLTALDVLDICNWAGFILSNRRAAEIALHSYGVSGWQEFARSKYQWWEGNPQRSQSNNSLIFWERPTKQELLHVMQLMVECGGSEPGIINGAEMRRRAPWAEGVNPCLQGDTLIPVLNRGLVKVSDLADGTTSIILDGEGKAVPVQFTMTSPLAELYEVIFSDGSSYITTPSHNFVCADGSLVAAKDAEGIVIAKPKNLQCFGKYHDPMNAYITAWAIADGTRIRGDKWRLYLYHDKMKFSSNFPFKFRFQETSNRLETEVILPQISKENIPAFVLQGDAETMRSFVRGYMQADGHISHHHKKGWQAQVACVELNFLRQFQALLANLGVRSKITQVREAGPYTMPGGTYDCRTIHRLSISNVIKLLEILNPGEDFPRGSYNIPAGTNRVVSVTPLKMYEPVYCCNVSTTHTFYLPTVVSGNCSEILLGDKSFCNLSEIALPKFTSTSDLHTGTYLLARANYRQTQVNLNDGMLQSAWHENNQFLRLCGVGLTGIVQAPMHDHDYAMIERMATHGAFSMAADLGTPYPKNITTIKPSGTVSKIMDVTEGVHKPIGRYILNNITFSRHDPLIPVLKAANYRVISHPTETDSVLVSFPVAWENVIFDRNNAGIEYNNEPALDQLNRYKTLMRSYVQQNCSVTIYYSPDEIPEIVNWLHDNWDYYVGVSFILRHDPTKSAKDLGYLYLPQEVITKKDYEEYTTDLNPVNIDGTTETEWHDIDAMSDCEGGMCPVR